MSTTMRSLTVRLLFLFIFLTLFTLVEANFEDSRCRCVCPSTEGFSSANSTDNKRRYYTKTNVLSSMCSPQNVVKLSVKGVVDDNHMDAFLANCDCRYESRNTVLLKVVVIFFICVLTLLCSYMLFLTILDPMFKRRRSSVNYKRQEDEIEENIFAQSQNDDSAPSSSSNIPMRVSRAANIIEKVESQRWHEDVEEQRRKVYNEHSVLN